MLNFPPPPQPPLDNERYLEELADYYRQLIDYYQRAAKVAANQLTHVEALLNPSIDVILEITDTPPRLGVSSTPLFNMMTEGLKDSETQETAAREVLEKKFLNESDDLEGNEDKLWLISEKSENFLTDLPYQEESSNHPIKDASPQEDFPDDTQEFLDNDNSYYDDVQLEEEFVTNQFISNITDEIESLLERHQGQVLHTQDILKKLYEEISEDDLETLTVTVQKILKEGVQQEKWYEMPNAAECWTIDIDDFPNGVAAFKKNQIPPNTLATKKVAAMLKISATWILEIRARYSEQFIEGIHYYQDARRFYYWSTEGINLVEKLLQQLGKDSKYHKKNLRKAR